MDKGILNHLKPSYTYIWSVQSCYELLSPCRITSPVFIVESLQRTAWSLIIGEESDDILCILKRLDDDGPCSAVNILFEIALLNVDGKPLIFHTYQYSFLKDEAYFNFRFARIDDIFYGRRIEFVSNHALTFRCRMTSEQSAENYQDLCFACTRLAIEYKSFILVVKDFSTLQKGKTIPISLTEDNYILLDLCMVFENYKEFLTLFIRSTMALRFTYRICVMDLLGRVFASVQHKASLSTVAQFYLFEKKDLMDNHETCLPMNELTLRCEFIYGTGSQRSQIESLRRLPKFTKD
ncbi:TD and POZ domain-containing protein 4 [Nephila pilipes]|uniref:TD and POZ domain-containing protein 4 n=1 Tax=Nephila pilipes TaxID=299642 RepID=A0A8X6UHP9_NEPPI|nr:TD and POZ domain-containing protein 4 [Nephila pilipes]